MSTNIHCIHPNSPHLHINIDMYSRNPIYQSKCCELKRKSFPKFVCVDIKSLDLIWSGLVSQSDQMLPSPRVDCPGGVCSTWCSREGGRQGWRGSNTVNIAVTWPGLPSTPSQTSQLTDHSLSRIQTNTPGPGPQCFIF